MFFDEFWKWLVEFWKHNFAGMLHSWGTVNADPVKSLVWDPICHWIILFIIFIFISAVLLCKSKLIEKLSRYIMPLSVTVWLLGVLIYIVGFYNSGVNGLSVVLRAIVSSFKMFVVSHDLARIPQFLQNDSSYMTAFAVLHFAAAFITFLFIFKLVGYKIKSSLRLIFHKLFHSKGQVVHLFWGVNEASVLLAEDIRKQHATETIIFVDIDKENDDNLQKVLAIKQINASLQQQLMQGCAAYRDYTQYLSHTWRDVQAKLGKNDVAIEFTTVPLSPLDKDNYILALILSSTGEPTMSVISTRAILKNMKAKADLYDNSQYYSLIWGFMQEHLTGKQRVYFTPDNNLSDIAIEYLTDGQQTFFEKYEVYRLSSTTELCRDYSETAASKSITIFGDIDYNTELVAENRGGVSFGRLKYGREEIDGIKSSVKKTFKTTIYDGKKATEEQFRELSNRNPVILHISSHGEYDGDDKANETDAMENSLLALSGANACSDDILNDGIITAADIAQMSLRQCDMAVLSACNTGIGGKGSDGIFGLQRGFKNAGVHSLLMSLKPVYDESTAKLMIAFYQGLAQGKSKRQSLLDAQKHIKSIGYTEGKYWAPFILLDGIK